MFANFLLLRISRKERQDVHSPAHKCRSVERPPFAGVRLLPSGKNMASNSKLFRRTAALLCCCWMYCTGASLASEGAISPKSGATAVSVSTIGAQTNWPGGYKIYLPEITITESYFGALKPNAFIAIGADYRQISSFDVSSATLKAYRVSDNADVTSVIVGNNPFVADPAPSATNIADIVFKLSAASTSETGPIKLVIADIQAIVGVPSDCNPNLDIYDGKTLSIKIGGSDTSGAGLDTLAQIDGSLGSGATAQTLSFRIVLVACAITPYPCGMNPITITGSISAQTISILAPPAGYDQGKQGSFFVVARLPPALGGRIFFMSSAGTWSPFISCETAPAYYTGCLKRLLNMPIVSTPSDLTSLKDTEIYVGYGAGDVTSAPGAACEYMLQNGTYFVAYTIR